MNPADTQSNLIPTIRKAGLTDSQARAYLALIEQGDMTPVQIATATGESRTNAYMLCDKLVTLGLATKKEGPKALYSAAHPSAIEQLAEKRRKVIVRNEQEVKQNLSVLIDLYYAATDLPGTRTLQGVEGIKSLYSDTLNAPNRRIDLLRTPVDGPTLGHEYFAKYRKQRAKAGIETHALTPMTDISYQHIASGEDESLLYYRTPIPHNAYTAPVEIDVYGDRVAFIAFTGTQMATIIDSAPIAEAMRQVLHLLRVHFREKNEAQP